MEEMIRLYTAGRDYIQALKDNGLWDPGSRRARGDIDYHRKKLELQQKFTFPEMPMFYLDKVETKTHAEELEDELLDEYEETESLTQEEFYSKYWSRPHHDRDLPELLLNLLDYDVLTQEAAIALLKEAWTGTEFPTQNDEETQDRWTSAFSSAGWVSDDGSTRPTEPVRLYRGAVPECSYGMSWTGDVEKARWFAKRFGPEGEVFCATFQPGDLLARFTGRNEDEYVVDIDVVRAISFEPLSV
jgi:hypothetical protein